MWKKTSQSLSSVEMSQVVISELLFRDCHELEALLLCGVTESVRW